MTSYWQVLILFQEKPELYENVVQLLEGSKKAKEEKAAAVQKAKNAFKKKGNLKAKQTKPQNNRNQSAMSGGSTASQDSRSSQSDVSVQSLPTNQLIPEPFTYYKRDEIQRRASAHT